MNAGFSPMRGLGRSLQRANEKVGETRDFVSYP